MKWGEVHKKKRKFSWGGIQAKISEREVLAQEHKEKCMNSVFFCITFGLLGQVSNKPVTYINTHL